MSCVTLLENQMRRGWDSNPGSPKGSTVFETVPFNRSGTSPSSLNRPAWPTAQGEYLQKPTPCKGNSSLPSTRQVNPGIPFATVAWAVCHTCQFMGLMEAHPTTTLQGKRSVTGSSSCTVRLLPRFASQAGEKLLQVTFSRTEKLITDKAQSRKEHRHPRLRPQYGQHYAINAVR